MAVFAVIAQPGQNAEKLPAALAATFPQASLLLRDGVWLVSFTGTAVDVSNQLGISKGDSGAGIVVQLSGDYFGLANASIWTWLKNSFEAANRG